MDRDTSATAAIKGSVSIRARLAAFGLTVLNTCA